VHDAAAATLGLSSADKQELLPSGTQPTYKNRAGWAHDRLKRAGLSESVRKGFWRLTDEGLGYAREHASPLSSHEVEFDASSVTLTASPDDRLEAALAELRVSVAAEIIESVRKVSPAFFETIVLDLLHRIGYGASRADLQRVGGSADGGIDGIISLDRLGLEKVYVQAKRWQQPVGRRSWSWL
jgi:restriction system protein